MSATGHFAAVVGLRVETENEAPQEAQIRYNMHTKLDAWPYGAGGLGR